jgi:WhiB family redox-sensing transcriptional regulator
MTNHEWAELANCQRYDPDKLFVLGAQQHQSKWICQGCPVKQECLADALDNRIEWGVWGGLTERQRRALLRRHPHVTSWRQRFAAANAANRGPAPDGTEKLLEFIRARAEKGVWATPSLSLIRRAAPPDSPMHTKPHLLLGRLERSGHIKVFWDVPIRAIVVIGEISARQLKALNREYNRPGKRQNNAV